MVLFSFYNSDMPTRISQEVILEGRTEIYPKLRQIVYTHNDMRNN
jgi:hypothetical protein